MIWKSLPPKKAIEEQMAPNFIRSFTLIVSLQIMSIGCGSTESTEPSPAVHTEKDESSWPSPSPNMDKEESKAVGMMLTRDDNVDFRERGANSCTRTHWWAKEKMPVVESAAAKEMAEKADGLLRVVTKKDEEILSTRLVYFKYDENKVPYVLGDLPKDLVPEEYR